MKLSICFTVYNQYDLLKKRLDSISDVLPDDIEVIVSDDCSTDDIKGLVNSYNNRNIKYFRTDKNIGHDLNILHAIDCSSAKYVMVLRTRDNVKCKNIHHIIEEIEKHPRAGYFLFSADYENKSRLKFSNNVYNGKDNAFWAHYHLPEHPSGNIYNKEYLDINLYRRYIEEFFEDIYGFSVHELIRCDLSRKCDFVTSSIVGWEYADTLKANDKAVNSAKNGVNVYSPEMNYPRFKCQFIFVKNEININKIEYLKHVIFEYYSFTIGKAITIASDKRYYSHYSSKKQTYDRRKVANELDKILDEMLSDVDSSTKNILKKHAKTIRNKYVLLYPIKEMIRNMVLYTPIYSLYRDRISEKVIQKG